MRFLVSFAFLAMFLTAGCTQDIEKYVSENNSKGVIFVYGNSYFFSSFKPREWLSERKIYQTNNLSLYLHPTNSTVRIIAYGILLTNKGADQSALISNDAQGIYQAELSRHPGLKIEKIATTVTVDKALQVQRYRYTSKTFYQESLYIVWNRSAVLLAMQTEDKNEIDFGLRKFDIFVSQIKYWGTDADALSYRVIKAIFKK